MAGDRADELRQIINNLRISEGMTSMAFGPFYQEVLKDSLYQKWGYATVEEWAAGDLDHGKTQVYETARIWTVLQNSFSDDVIRLMTYTNARFLVFVFGDFVPTKLRTADVAAAAHDLPRAKFEAYLRTLRPDIPKDTQTGKTFVLSGSQKGTVQHAINRLKREEGIDSDGEALTTMAVRSLSRDLPATILDLCYKLVLKHEAVRLDMELRGSKVPSEKQWAELEAIAIQAGSAFSEKPVEVPSE